MEREKGTRDDIFFPDHPRERDDFFAFAIMSVVARPANLAAAAAATLLLLLLLLEPPPLPSPLPSASACFDVDKYYNEKTGDIIINMKQYHAMWQNLNQAEARETRARRRAAERRTRLRREAAGRRKESPPGKDPRQTGNRVRIYIWSKIFKLCRVPLSTPIYYSELINCF